MSDQQENEKRPPPLRRLKPLPLGQQQKPAKPFRVADLDDQEFKQLYDALM